MEKEATLLESGIENEDLCSFYEDELTELYSSCGSDTYRVRGGTTSGGFVKILEFRHFERFFRFDQSDRKTYKKSISDGVNVSVVLNVVAGNTSNI